MRVVERPAKRVNARAFASGVVAEYARSSTSRPEGSHVNERSVILDC